MPKGTRLIALGALAALLLLVQDGATGQGGSPAALPCPGTRSASSLAASWFPSDGQLQWRAGRQALERGEWGQAACYLSRAQSLLPPNSSLLLDLGDALSGGGDLQAATARWSAALELDPRSSQVLQRLRSAYQSQGQWQDLERVLQAWLTLHPDDHAAESQLAEVTAALDPQEALGLLQELRRNGKTPDAGLEQLDTTIQDSQKQGGAVYAYARVGELFLQREDWSLARVALEEAVKQNPAYGEAFAYLGYALEKSGQPSEWAYTRGVSLSPQDGMTHFLYGSYLARQREFPQARKELQLAWDLGPRTSLIASQLGALEYSAGNLETAQQWYAQGVKLFPGDEMAWIDQAEFSFECNLQVDETGIPAARQAVMLSPRDPRAIDLLGLGWFLSGDLPTAERLFWEALDQEPNYVPALFHLGMLAESRSDMALAAAFYQEVIDLDPQSSMAQSAGLRIERMGIFPR